MAHSRRPRSAAIRSGDWWTSERTTHEGGGPLMKIDGAVAVVTGGASGIGRATVLELARRGADVAVADIHEERLEEVRVAVEELGRRVLTVRCDVAFDDHVDRLRHEVLEE